MRKILLFMLALAFMLTACSASADSVTRMHYVCGDYIGEYTGMVDTNSIPFGFGVFISETPMNDVTWHYIGIWENGVPEGEGTMYFEDGSIYKGTFKGGRLTDGKKYSATGLMIEEVKPDSRDAFAETQYIGNKNSRRFHYPTCRSVTQMREKNKIEFSTREEAIENGYTPCGDCNP